MSTTTTRFAHSLRAGTFRPANRSVPSYKSTLFFRINASGPSKSRFSRVESSAFARSFHASHAVHDFHFDTHHFVQRLEREGLNRAQAEGIMGAMAEVIDESIRNMTSNMVTKAQQEKVSAPTAFRGTARLNKWGNSTAYFSFVVSYAFHSSINTPNKSISHS